MDKKVHLVLLLWIISHVGHAVFSVFYEKFPDYIIVPGIYAGFVLLTIGVWRRNPWTAVMCMLAAFATVVLHGIFIWKREAYGSLSIPVLVFDIMGVVAAALYLFFFFSQHRERYFQKTKNT